VHEFSLTARRSTRKPGRSGRPTRSSAPKVSPRRGRATSAPSAKLWVEPLSRNPHRRSSAALSRCPLSQTRGTRDSTISPPRQPSADADVEDAPADPLGRGDRGPVSAPRCLTRMISPLGRVTRARDRQCGRGLQVNDKIEFGRRSSVMVVSDRSGGPCGVYRNAQIAQAFDQWMRLLLLNLAEISDNSQYTLSDGGFGIAREVEQRLSWLRLVSFPSPNRRGVVPTSPNRHITNAVRSGCVSPVWTYPDLVDG